MQPNFSFGSVGSVGLALLLAGATASEPALAGCGSHIDNVNAPGCVVVADTGDTGSSDKEATDPEYAFANQVPACRTPAECATLAAANDFVDTVTNGPRNAADAIANAANQAAVNHAQHMMRQAQTEHEISMALNCTIGSGGYGLLSGGTAYASAAGPAGWGRPVSWISVWGMNMSFIMAAHEDNGACD